MSKRCWCLIALISLALVISCNSTSGRSSVSSVSVGDSGNSEDSDAGAGLPVSSGSMMVYAAHRGVSTPWLVPVGKNGVGESVALGPRRGAGYGMGEGDVSYPMVAPDGTRVVVVFYPMATPASSGDGDATIFALALDGDDADTPVRVATAAELRVQDRAMTDTWLAYVDGNSLYAARLDGSDAESPHLITTVSEGQEINSPRWLDAGTLSYILRDGSGGSQRQAMWVELSPERITEPQILFTAVGSAKHVAASLPGRRVVVSGEDQRLYVTALAGDSAPVAITPSEFIGKFVGATADGDRVVAELRVTWKEERELISVATDGSDADTPIVLTTAPLKGLSSIMSRDGMSVAWAGQDANGRWAAFRADDLFVASPTDPRVSDWIQSAQLHLTSFDASADALISNTEEGAILRYNGTPGAPSAPQVLARVDNIVNSSGPWPLLSADATHVLYDANTTTGWHSWVVALSGGEPLEQPAPWYRDLITPYGVLTHEYVNEGALFATDGNGVHIQISPWHDTELVEPHLVEGEYVVYACESPVPGYYAASTSGATMVEGSEMNPVLVMPVDSFVDRNRQLTVVAGHIIEQSGTEIRSYRLDGSDAAAPKLLTRTATQWSAVDTRSGRVLFVSGQTLFSVPTDASAAPTIVMTFDGGSVNHLSVLPQSRMALLGLNDQSSTTLLMAALDGSTEAPLLVASGLPGEFLTATPTHSEHDILTVHAIEFGAVPRPDLLMASPTGFGGTALTGASHPIAPMGFHPWNMLWDYNVYRPNSTTRLTTSADGEHLALLGPDGLYSATINGTQSDAPAYLGPATLPLGNALSPDGDYLLLIDEQAVVISRIDGAEPQRTLTAALDGSPVDAAWTPDGNRVVILAANSSFSGAGTLSIVDTTTADLTVLHLDPFEVREFAGFTLDGEFAIVRSYAGKDRSLYRIRLDPEVAGQPSTPEPITLVDDVGEQFIGFVDSAE